MTIRWPEKVLRVPNFAIDLVARSLSGPSSVNGSSQVVASDAGIWKATLGGVIVKSRHEVLCFRAIAAILDGRVNPILIPLCRAYQPTPADYADLATPVPHDDASLHDDDTGYVGSATVVSLANDAAARAVTADITITHAGTVEPGQHFSIGERLYRIRTISYSSPTAATITFRPPLRAAAPAGQELNFDDPAARMRLATDGEMDLYLEGRRFATPTVNLVEDL